MNPVKYRIFLGVLIVFAFIFIGILYFNSVQDGNNYSDGTLVRNTIESCVNV